MKLTDERLDERLEPIEELLLPEHRTPREMVTHTSGPWLAFWDEHGSLDRDKIQITTEDRMDASMVPIAVVGINFSEPFGGEQKANARLLAAAPDLLKTLKSVRATLVRLAWEENSLMVDSIDAAILAATSP